MTNTSFQNIKIISAGAGSGKTYRLTEEMVALLKGGVRASGIIATTFTKKAAAELQERVRVKLLEQQLSDEADQLTNAMIGTVHGLGVQLLKRFAFEAGVSPQVDIIADEDHQLLFNQSLTTVLTADRMAQMELLSTKLGLNKRGPYDWRREVKNVTDIARSNDFSVEVLLKSKEASFTSFKEYLGKKSGKTYEGLISDLKRTLQATILELEGNEDSTKVTEKGADDLKKIQRKLNLENSLEWYEWVKISKIKVGAKSKDAVVELQELARLHESMPKFHEDIKSFIETIFDIAIEAIKEYDAYKKRRGLIDYIDMELHVKRLLENKQVQMVLTEELDLLMVDEFQDTSPIQLEIFLKLSQFAKHSIWVGDPKQSIYGFRGADPALMQAIIEQTGGVKEEDIQKFSWRSRTGVVHATNALFTKAFDGLDEEQVALEAKRTEETLKILVKDQEELKFLKKPLQHWHFEYDGKGRAPGKPWMENSIATAIKNLLAEGVLVFPKEESEPRLARPGDVAVLCRSNIACGEMAEALHRAGLKAAISRNGLLQKTESKLVLACLKFIVSKNDPLSVAEILKLASGQALATIIDERLAFLKEVEKETVQEWKWGQDNPYVKHLLELRDQVKELSSSEIINLVLDELDLRRIISTWGNKEQRLANIDELRKLALKYEEACNRLHSAATLGGFLLWLNEMDYNKADLQSSGAGADAVNVMTYHKSKGLEWPIVVCHSLEGKLRDNIWGTAIVAETKEVDLNNILGNRWLRYWVNPYSDQIGGTNLEERLNASKVKVQAQADALKEEARVLYVGVTRARDYLVFPTRAVPTKWLNRVWHKGDETVPSLDHFTDESPWVWNNQILLKETNTTPFPRDFTTSELAIPKITFLAERRGKGVFIPYEIDVERESYPTEFSPKPSKIHQYGKAIIPTEEGRDYVLAKAVKAFLTADNLTTDNQDREMMAKDLLERYGVEELLEHQDLMDHSQRFLDYLNKEFQPIEMLKKYPIRHHHKGRLFDKIVDLVLETDKGFVLIQNSGFTGDSKQWKNKALALSTWLYLAAEGINNIFGDGRVRCFINYPMGGGMVEVVLNKQAVLF